MSVKQCETWDETERETDACVASERAFVCVSISWDKQVSCTEASGLWLS